MSHWTIQGVDPDGKAVPSSIPVLGPVLSVEIKPKMGFMPFTSMVGDSSNAVNVADVKRVNGEASEVAVNPPPNEKEYPPEPLICRFHSIQHRKLEQGRIRRFSSYCPLDLFSGYGFYYSLFLILLRLLRYASIMVTVNSNVLPSALQIAWTHAFCRHEPFPGPTK